MNIAALPDNPYLIWADVLAKTGEMMFASLAVIGQRSERMAGAGAFPNQQDRDEFALMGHEKLEAATESASRMLEQLGASNAQLTGLALRQMLSHSKAMLGIATSQTPWEAASRQMELARQMLSDSAVTGNAAASAAGHLAGQGLRPVHGRATGNARRLAGRQAKPDVSHARSSPDSAPAPLPSR